MQTIKRRFSPYLFLGSLLTLVIIVTAAAFTFLQTAPTSQAKAAKVVNPNCSLILPEQPLTAQGLATPYQLVATKRGDGACHQANKVQSAFVQGAIFDPKTNQISIYNPLVIDRGDQPAVAPAVPQVAQGAIVALWFGFNGTNLTLKSVNQSLATNNCVNGLGKSIFGQYAYCNAPAFFTAANQAIQAGKLTVPALGMGNDGLVCPTVRDFSVTDQDQSDNVTTEYLLDRRTGRLAQNTVTNSAQLPLATVLTNGSDNRLLAVALDGALGCKPWTAPDLANPGHNVTALPLDELQAASHQTALAALIPSTDPMVLVNGKPNVQKINLYRAGVNQPAIQSRTQASPITYCQNLLDIAPQRIFADRSLTQEKPSADPLVANNLFTFLAQRFNNSWGAAGLNCVKLVGEQSPIKVKMRGNIAINATQTTANQSQQDTGKKQVADKKKHK